MDVYEGTENYIFVSYAHRDNNVVLPIIETLQQSGFRVWYDSGIEAGTEWPAYIEEHLQACTRVLVFMSPAAVASVNCRNEINFACLIQKEMLVVYLERTELSQGMNLQLNSVQSMFKYNHATAKPLLDALINARILQCCRSDSSASTYDLETEEDVSRNDFLEDFSEKLDILEAQNSGNRELLKKCRQNGPSIISKVGSLPSNDSSEAFPSGSYSRVMNVDLYHVIYFHCTLVRPSAKDEIKTIGMQIYDSNESLIHESITQMEFRKGYDRISKGWVVKDSSGSFYNPDRYTAVFWIDDSKVFEYQFQIIAPSFKKEDSEIIQEVDSRADGGRDTPQGIVSILHCITDSIYAWRIPFYPLLAAILTIVCHMSAGFGNDIGKHLLYQTICNTSMACVLFLFRKYVPRKFYVLKFIASVAVVAVIWRIALWITSVNGVIYSFGLGIPLYTALCGSIITHLVRRILLWIREKYE